MSTPDSRRDDYIASVIVGDGADARRPVVVVDYDPAWPAMFAALEERIRAALGGAVIALEHVGSTSVPGLAAKPIIDIDLTVPDSADEASYVPALEAAGFALRVREPDWHAHRMLRGTGPDCNLHVFSPGAEPPVRDLILRDRLRAHDADRDRYAEVKRELAKREWTYVQHYADAKTGVVREILARAGYHRPLD
ncbi:MAG TPA: GrpB family protein [Stackebrandtia sp.]|uniref:GrpB family protein n=1 Tax=Stackebrandtia sp. TaxID=2023065 RepID=UPI002D5A9AF4|nr:GrpB family protein [Stackebrandtia sp.]HZE37611.1 GrpB family protein [Stackebrandtia sp.]